jgi:hypothetical protein
MLRNNHYYYSLCDFQQLATGRQGTADFASFYLKRRRIGSDVVFLVVVQRGSSDPWLSLLLRPNVRDLDEA